MQLTRQTDYGLRALIYLALRPSQRVSAGEIAGAFAVSQNHLMKVINRLAAGGFVTTYRGKGGGISLAVPAAQIAVGAVVRRLEDDLQIIDCNQPPCALRGACTLKGVIDQAVAAFLAVLDRYSLEDVVNDREDVLQNLLTIAPGPATGGVPA